MAGLIYVSHFDNPSIPEYRDRWLCAARLRRFYPFGGALCIKIRH